MFLLLTLNSMYCRGAMCLDNTQLIAWINSEYTCRMQVDCTLRFTLVLSDFIACVHSLKVQYLSLSIWTTWCLQVLQSTSVYFYKSSITFLRLRKKLNGVQWGHSVAKLYCGKCRQKVLKKKLLSDLSLWPCDTAGLIMDVLKMNDKNSYSRTRNISFCSSTLPTTQLATESHHWRRFIRFTRSLLGSWKTLHMQ